MFTGLIADLGEVSECRRNELGARLRIRTPLSAQISPGDSVAVNGVCLTATEVDGVSFRAEAILETLHRSTLGDLIIGSPVNLELSLRADGRLGGHIVQGHVDGVGIVTEIADHGFGKVLSFRVEDRLARYLVEKGSVAVEGVSLTVSSLADNGFSVSLIPETLQRTNLAALELSDQVNIETDILAKHIERLMEAHR